MPTASRKLLAYGALLVLTAAAAGSATAADAPTPLPVPAKGCATFSDPADDATPFNFGAPFPAGPSDPDLDITSVVLASPPGKLRAYIKVAKLGSPSYGAGHSFSVSFMHNGRRALFFATQDQEPVESAHAATGDGTFVQAMSGVKYDGGIVPGATTDAVFDATTSTVVLTTDRAPIEKASKTPLTDGTDVTEVIADSANDSLTSNQTADVAKATGYTVGDNSCFSPPQGKLTLSAPVRAVAGHTVVLSGALTDLAGKASATRTVGITLGRLTTSVRTATTGAYRAPLRLEVPAGSYTVGARWAGDPSLATATATARIVVSAQPTRCALAGTASRVTLVLVDDLGHPLAGKPVTWSVDGKATSTGRTDANGRATFSTTPGHTVKATYAGDRTRYLGSAAARQV